LSAKSQEHRRAVGNGHSASLQQPEQAASQPGATNPASTTTDIRQPDGCAQTMPRTRAGSRPKTPASPEKLHVKSQNAAPRIPELVWNCIGVEKASIRNIPVCQPAASRQTANNQTMTNLNLRRTSSPTKVPVKETPDEGKKEPDFKGTQCPNRFGLFTTNQSSAI